MALAVAGLVAEEGTTQVVTTKRIGQVRALPLTRENLVGSALAADLLVHATPIGMALDGRGSIWPEGVPVPEHLMVCDLVYNPPETRLMRQARESGARYLSRLEMLVHQGALAFELWTGQSPPLGVMRAAARAALVSKGRAIDDVVDSILTFPYTPPLKAIPVHHSGAESGKATKVFIPHGAAVAVGLVAAARLAARLGMCDPGLARRVKSVLQRLGLPSRCQGYTPTQVWQAMATDKKRHGARLRFVLPCAVGDVTVTDEVSSEDVLAVLDEMVRWESNPFGEA